MPTTITGSNILNNVLTGNPPVLEGPPVVSMPLDGEAATSGPIVEAFKQVMAEIAWLKNPKPRLAVWYEAIRRYRNYLGHTRFAIDHQGLPAGRIFHATESWLDVGLVQKNTAASDAIWAGLWRYDIAGAMMIETLGPDYSQSPAPCLHLQSTSGTAGTVLVYGARPWILRSPDQTITWQTELAITDVTDIGAVTMEFGFGDPGSTTGARFVKRNTDANWQFLSNVTGSNVYTDLGWWAGGPGRRRLRFEWIGASGSDDGVARIVPYIDGNQIAPISYVSATPQAHRPYFKLQRVSAGTGAAFNCFLSTLDVCSSLWNHDVSG